MDLLNSGLYEFSYSTTTPPIISRIRTKAIENQEKIADYYSRSANYLSSTNIFLQLLNRINGYMGATPAETYAILSDNGLDIAYSFKMSSVNEEQDYFSLFYGRDYLLVADGFSFQGEEVVKPTFSNAGVLTSKNLRPVRMLYHDDTSFKPITSDTENTGGHSITWLDLPLFGAIYHQWVNDLKETGATRTNIDFVINTVYVPIYLDIVNLTLFNLYGNVEYITDDDAFIESIDDALEKSKSFHMISFSNEVKELVSQVQTALAAKGTLTLMQTLKSLPLITEKDASELLCQWSTYYDAGLLWPTYLIQVNIWNQATWVAETSGAVLSDTAIAARLKMRVTNSALRLYSKPIPRIDRPWFMETTALI